MILYYLKNNVPLRVGFVFTSEALKAGEANIDPRGLADESRAKLVEKQTATGEDFAVLVHTALRAHDKATCMAVLEAFGGMYQSMLEQGTAEADMKFTHKDLVDAYAAGVASATGAWSDAAGRKEAIKALSGLMGEGVAGLQAVTPFVT